MLDETRCNGIFSLSCFSLVRSRCLFCAALCTLNCVEYHECASCIIDVGLHAVRCIIVASSADVMEIEEHSARLGQDAEKIFGDSLTDKVV